MSSYSPANIAADVIRLYKPDFIPKYAVTLGSGLGAFAEKLKDATVIPYTKLPGFPSGNIEGHAYNLVLGTMHGVPIVCLQGRPHLYQGDHDSFKPIIRALKLIGCEALILTNAVGSLRPKVGPGNLVVITDQINFQGSNILIGPNDAAFGERFTPMGDAYDIALREKLFNAAKELKLELHEGVLIGVTGPCFETPAEIRAFKTLGADMVSMSVIPETIVARHCGLKVAGISVVTNLAEGLSDVKLSHAQTLAGAELGTQKLISLLSTFIADNS